MAGEVLFTVYNSTRPTTAAPVAQPTGTAIRTMLQLATGTAKGLYIVEWGISFDGSAAGAGIKCELFGCTGAATMSTALAATDVQNMTDPGGNEASSLQYSTALSAYATAAVTEGTVANYRSFDMQEIQPTNQYVKQFPLGREPKSLLSTFVRVRVTAAASVGCFTYVVFGH